MTKTLTQYPGVVNYLLTRTSHLPPPPPREIPRDPFTPPNKGLGSAHRVRARRQISHSMLRAIDTQLHLTPALGHTRLQWCYAPATRRSTRLHTFIRTAIPLLFIVAIAFVAGCLAAILETSFSP